MSSINWTEGVPDDLMLDENDPGFKAFLEEPEEAAKLQTANDFREELLKRMYEEPEIIGPPMRLKKLEDVLRFPSGQVTAWVGFNGHGKSLATSQVALDMAMLDEPALICSFEMSPMATLHRMVRQSAGCARPTRDWTEGFLRWAQGRIWIYNHRGQAASDRVLKLSQYAARKLGVKHTVIDSLMKCVKGEDDFNGQKDFVDGCCQVAMDSVAPQHIHLVHHVRKGVDEYSVPGKMDAKGTGAIMDQVDTAVVVWRNLRLEEQRRLAKDGEEIDTSKPDAIFSIVKSRHIEEAEGKYGLWYSVGAQSYTEVRGRPLIYPLNDWVPDREVAL